MSDCGNLSLFSEQVCSSFLRNSHSIQEACRRFLFMSFNVSHSENYLNSIFTTYLIGRYINAGTIHHYNNLIKIISDVREVVSGLTHKVLEREIAEAPHLEAELRSDVPKIAAQRYSGKLALKLMSQLNSFNAPDR